MSQLGDFPSTNATHTHDDTRARLQTVLAVIRVFANLEGQDSVLTLDYVEDAIGRLLAEDPEQTLEANVRRYCDVIDGPADAQRIADYIAEDVRS